MPPPPLEPLPDEALARAEAALAGTCGLSLTPGQRRALGLAVHDAARALGTSPLELVTRAAAGEERPLEALVARAVVGETHFFRHPQQLAAVTALAPELAPEPLLLWSAGCASGEEAYGLAMLLLEAGRPADFIVATDVSEEALAQAREARYGSWTLRRVGPERRARWFRGAGDGRLEVVEAVRERVGLRRHNLVSEPPPWTFDVVLCRNVVIHFSPETARLVLRRLCDAVRPGGLLVLGPVELPLAEGLPVAWLEREGATVLRRLPPAPRGAGEAR